MQWLVVPNNHENESNLSQTAEVSLDFRFRQLQCFLALTERLNYGQAARAQFMSQPTLSFQIKSLEESFGARLFDRNHKGVKLTAAGQHLAASARRILAEVENAHRNISGVSSHMPLRVCCSQVGQIEILPRLMRHLAEYQPNLQLNVQYTIPEERIEALQNNKLDVLMLVAPVQAPAVTFELLRRESPIAVLPDLPQYRGRASISIHEFAANTLLIASERECRYGRSYAIELMRNAHLSPPTVESPINLNFRLAMVASGKGASIGSKSLLLMRYPGVVFLPFEESLPRTMLGVAWRSDDTSESLKIFRETLVKVSRRRAHEEESEPLPVLAGPYMEARNALSAS